MATWFVQYKNLDDFIGGTWSDAGTFPDDEGGARNDYHILKNVYVNVRIGKQVIEWEGQ